MKRFISLLLSVCMVFSFVLPAGAAGEAPAASGSCGDGVTWAFDESTGTLTISGEGEMYDYKGDDVAPWQDERTNIKKIIVGEGITYIGINAFRECPNLTEAVLPETLKAIGHMAFWRCESLEQINFPDGLEFIGNWTFSDSAIAELAFPASVKQIGEGAFFDCRSLKTVTFAPNSELTELASQLFGGCSQLMTVKLPDGLKKINEGVFGMGEDPDRNAYACENLTAIDLPEGLEYIGEAAFNSCGLTSITIPGSVTEIGELAFFGCENLKTVAIKEGVSSIGRDAFNGCTALESVAFPSSLKGIGNNAFFDCKSLTEVVLPEGVTTIGQSAFNSCTSLKTIVIPASVASIGSGALYPGENNESALEKILYGGSEEQWRELMDAVAENGGLGIDWDSIEMKYNYQPPVVEPEEPTPPAQSGGSSGGDGSAAILLVGGAAAAAAGIYFYTHPDVLPAAIEKVKEFAADVSECVQSKVQALSDGVRGAGQKWLPLADDEEQEAQEQPAA